MGLFSKLVGASSRNSYPVPTGRNMDAALFEGSGSMAVVGESNYQPALRTSWQACEGKGARKRECYGILQPEPSNRFDPNAVAVHSVPGGLSGYLSRDVAARWHNRIAAAWRREGKPVAVAARIHTRDGDLFGLWLDWPDDFQD